MIKYTKKKVAAMTDAQLKLLLAGGVHGEEWHTVMDEYIKRKVDNETK